ncbi:MAG: LuxR C-terminal-related transcriptional regulator [Desulfovibrionales bacterium]
MRPKDVFVVSSYPVYREGIMARVAEMPNLNVTGQAEELDSILESLPLKRSCILIIDKETIDDHVLLSLENIRTKRVQSILICSELDMDIFLNLHELGVRGYLLRQSGTEELLQCLERVCAGTIHVDPPVLERLIDYFHEKFANQHINLTPLTKREIQILREITRKRSHQQIAQKFYISKKTVENHKHNIMKKLEARTFSDLVRYAERLKIIE